MRQRDNHKREKHTLRGKKLQQILHLQYKQLCLASNEVNTTWVCRNNIFLTWASNMLKVKNWSCIPINIMSGQFSRAMPL